MATRALQGKSGPVLFRHLFILALLCGQASRLSLQIWYCTPVSSEINPSRLFGGVVVRFPDPLYLWLLPLLLSGQGPPGAAAWTRQKRSGPAPWRSSLHLGSLLPSLPLFGCGIKTRAGFFLFPPPPPFLYFKFQSSRSRTTLLVPAEFSFSSHPSFNFTLSPALCLQAICVL